MQRGPMRKKKEIIILVKWYRMWKKMVEGKNDGKEHLTASLASPHTKFLNSVHYPVFQTEHNI
jgi:hypothetical protein